MSSKVDFDRKDLKTPDAFFENVGRANRYVQENRRLFIGGLAAVIAVFVTGVALHSYSEHSADEAAATFIRGADALDDNNTASAKAALENLSKRSGIYGELGRLYEADLAAREQRWDDALPKYEEVSRNGSSPYIRQIALIGQGFVLENTSKLAQAADAYAAAGNLTGPYREQALRDQMRAARAAGNDDVAKAAINKILELYPETPDADQLSAQLGTSPKAQ
jgi:hypothetical protein